MLFGNESEVKVMSEVLYMSIKDYAKRVSASTSIIYDMCRDGKLPAVKIGGWRINVKRADELFNQLCDERMARNVPPIKSCKVNLRLASNAGSNYLASLEQLRKGVLNVKGG